MRTLSTGLSQEEVLRKIAIFSLNMRLNILELGYANRAGSVHFGGALSIVDIVGTLYSSILKFDLNDRLSAKRDRFILSKGHGVLGFYTALYEAGFISRETLFSFETQGSPLLGHPVMNREIGIEFSTGSLGMGLSLGVGVALGIKRKMEQSRVFVLLGDGECNEGSVWEAAMAAAHFKLDNLVAVIDRNHFQQTGSGQDVMNLGDIEKKWNSFGWETMEIDGHNHSALHSAFTKPRSSGLPLAIISKTIKGKGIAEMENNNSWHHASITEEQFNSAKNLILEEISNRQMR